MADELNNQPPQTPSNLPTGGQTPPTPPIPPKEVSAPQEPDDMFADIDKEVSNQPVGRPATPIAPLGGSTSANQQAPRPGATPIANSAPKSYAQEKTSGSKSKIIIAIIAGVVILAAIGVGAWYGYTTFFAPDQVIVNTNLNAALNTNNTNNTNNSNTATNENSNTAAVNSNINVNGTIVERTVDTDGDGMSDKEEGLYGTDPNSPDSDNDGLTDRDEIKVFETDPNNSDTDADSFSDGDEVRAGYDPKGTGKLFEIPQ